MSDPIQRKAACCCGDCTVAVKGDPVVNGVCHCESCRRRTGSAFGWSAYFADDHILAQEGELALFVLDAADPERQQRSFCPRCGTTLLWKSASFPGHTGVAAGCFIEGKVDEPNLSASDDKRLHWLELPEPWLRMT